MNAEERFTRIENSIQALVEIQSRHEAQLEKQSAGIRDLIVVSRTLIDAQQSADKTINQLIVTVDRLASTVDQLSVSVNTLVKSFQKPNLNQ
jgi:hypothetical protein